MTFTIMAVNADLSQIGLATATKTLAVGADVPAVAPGVGAVATQAWTNRAFRAAGLELLRIGRRPTEVIDALRAQDHDFELRQVMVMNVVGECAVHTGDRITAWAGHRLGDGAAVAGNLLAGDQVLDEMLTVFAEATGPLSERLVAALLAGDGAGGDRRGRQSAAVMVVDHSHADLWPPELLVDVRVDDDDDAPKRLARLHRRWLAHLTERSAPPIRSPQ